MKKDSTEAKSSGTKGPKEPKNELWTGSNK